MRERGLIHSFDPAQGFGFIAREQGGEIRIEGTDVRLEGEAAVRQGDAVEFEVIHTQWGIVAADITRLEAGPHGPGGGARPGVAFSGPHGPGGGAYDPPPIRFSGASAEARHPVIEGLSGETGTHGPGGGAGPIE